MDASKILIESVRQIAESFLSHLPNLVIAALVLLIFWALNHIANNIFSNLLSRLKIRNSLKELFRKIISISVWVFAILIAATIVFPSFTPSKILTVVGLSSIAVGFAFKDIFENFLAGILILLREPFQIGDFIECHGLEGTVEDITIRDTNIRQVDGQRIVVPNAMLFKNPVYVRTDRDIRRITVICGVAYGEDVHKARKIIKDAVENLSSVIKKKPVEIFAREFNSSSIDFEVTWWTGSSQLEIRRSRDEVVESVKKALDKAGIEIPFPYRTLTFKESLSTKSIVEMNPDTDNPSI